MHVTNLELQWHLQAFVYSIINVSGTFRIFLAPAFMADFLSEKQAQKILREHFMRIVINNFDSEENHE